MKTLTSRSVLTLLLCHIVLLAIVAPVTATSITLNSESGDFVGGGITQTFNPVDGVFSTATGTGHVHIGFQGYDFWSFDFASASGTTIVPGAYEGAIRYPFNDGSNGLDVSGASRGSNTLTGRFDVLAANYGIGGTLQQFSANFEQHSEGLPPALFGQILYDINDATATPAQIRAATHMTPADIVNLLTFRSQIAGDPTGVYLTGQPGDFVVGDQTLIFLPSNASISVTGTRKSGVNVVVNTPDFSHFWVLGFLTPQSLDFAEGDWGGAARASFTSPTKPGLEVAGDGRGSNRLTGQFDVLQAEFGPDGNISRFDVIFEQHSEAGAPAAFGRVRFNSTVSAVPAPAGLILVGLGALVIMARRLRPGDQ